ncbi:MAG TPA: sporulation protein YqfD, partial [Candidatus Scybalomonas excrementigallinarum]|nr:sporulation protein YqfD [Candidatus Scybalomonas excrementigallinarum]
MLIHIYYYVLGYLKVRLTGYSPERFFNLCSNREIEIREVKADEEGGYVFLIGKSEYEEIQPLLEKTRTHAEVIDQYGLPYFLHRYRKRKLFFLGFL